MTRQEATKIIVASLSAATLEQIPCDELDSMIDELMNDDDPMYYDRY